LIRNVVSFRTNAISIEACAVIRANARNQLEARASMSFCKKRNSVATGMPSIARMMSTK